jgi:NAD(P)-dependent dehydrogenase (short-subunit alcohol dehydrogenase family)
MSQVASTSPVALVTGASAGIGLACADRLAARGWTVAGASRRGTGSASWSPLAMNVDDQSAVDAGIEAIKADHHRIDALVAAAGWGVAGAVEDTTVDEAKAQFETNFWGCVRVTQAVLPIMRAQGGGRIVLLSSIGGVIGIPFQAFYSASKFALEGFAESLAYEVAPFGVHVTLVQPGNFRTDFTSSRKLAAASASSVYADAVTKAVQVMERDELNGAAPELVAAAVERVLGARRPPRRVSVGKAGERAGLVARRLLPFRAFEAAAKGSLGVD